LAAALAAISLAGCGRPASSAPFVTADPRSLVVTSADLPPGFVLDASGTGPSSIKAFPNAGKGYRVKYVNVGNWVISEAVTFDSWDAAQQFEKATASGLKRQSSSQQLGVDKPIGARSDFFYSSFGPSSSDDYVILWADMNVASTVMVSVPKAGSQLAHVNQLVLQLADAQDAHIRTASKTAS
jgi:hypothetical protein